MLQDRLAYLVYENFNLIDYILLYSTMQNLHKKIKNKTNFADKTEELFFSRSLLADKISIFFQESLALI